jgi:hypothetical protein
VILETNFDRLMERALQDEGVEPLVIASASAAAVAPPVHVVRCVVVKLHGDRASPDLRNTLSELSVYDSDLSSYVAQLLRDHGLVVCGWSADWDGALRELVAQNCSRLFATFWAYRGDPSDRASDLIKGRIAHPIPIADADSFFEAVAGNVAALDDLAASSPDSSAVRVAELKRYLPDPIHRIRLQDLVVQDGQRVLAETAPEMLPVEGSTDINSYLRRLGEIEESAVSHAELLATLAFHADEARHDELVIRAVARLAKRPMQQSGLSHLINLQLYPALLAMFAAGLGALASGRPRPFARLWATERVETLLRDKPVSLPYMLATGQVLESELLKHTDEFLRHHTPCSDLLHSRLRPAIAPLIPSQADYDDAFDDVEYTLGLAVWHETDGWAPVGRFQWRRREMNRRGPRDAVVERIGVALVEEGMFAGSMDRLDEVHRGYEKWLSQIWMH